MVSSSGEIEFVSENVTNYLQYSQVSCACYAYIPSSVYKLFVLVLLAAADVLFDASASAAAAMMHISCTLLMCLFNVSQVKVMKRRLFCILSQKYICSFTL